MARGERRLGPRSFGAPPGAKQSNALLILITEMILIHAVAEPSASHPRTARGRLLEALPLSLLKATSPVGPFHLSVFNYMKWIPWEREKLGGKRGGDGERKAHKGEKCARGSHFSFQHHCTCQRSCPSHLLSFCSDRFLLLHSITQCPVYKWIEKGRGEKADVKRHQGHAETDKGKKKKNGLIISFHIR